MPKKRSFFLPFASLLGGFFNGFFGSGGGIPLVFALGSVKDGKSKYRITLSFCVAWSAVCLLFFSSFQKLFLNGYRSVAVLFLCSALGGFVGSRLLFFCKSVWVKYLFCALLFCSGGVMIWRSFR